jgi:hypothetical protein
MSHPIDQDEAHDALSTIRQSRQDVLGEINVPWWYWFGLAGGWIGLGLIGQFGPAWAAVAGTLLFGAGHAAVAPRVITGRRGSQHLSIRPEVVSRRIPQLVIGFVIAMIGVTVGIALLLHASGASYSGVWACAVVAVLVLIGGPALMTSIRRRAGRALT